MDCSIPCFHVLHHFLELAETHVLCSNCVWASQAAPACQCRRYEGCGFAPWVGKVPWRREWLPTPVILPGKPHRQRSLVGSMELQRIRHHRATNALVFTSDAQMDRIVLYMYILALSYCSIAFGSTSQEALPP